MSKLDDVVKEIVNLLRMKSTSLNPQKDYTLMRLGDVLEISRGISVSNNQRYNEYQNDRSMPYVMSSDITGGQIKDEKLTYLDLNENSNIYQYKTRVNDILMTIRGRSIGKLVLISEQSGNYIVSSQLAILRSKKQQIDHEYLYHVLSSHYVQNQIESFSITSGHLTALSLGDVERISIPLPTLQQQYQIVKSIEIEEHIFKEPRLAMEETSLEELIRKGESNTLEFKASLRKPTKYTELIVSKQRAFERANGPEKNTIEQILKKELNNLEQELEREVFKTVAAFMNSQGGILLVGIEDDGTISGIEKDFETFKDRKNWDGWLQHFINLVRNHIGTEHSRLLTIESIVNNNKTIAKISIQPSHEPVYVEYIDHRGQEKMEFYIRGFNTTQALNLREANSYIKSQWGR